MKGGVIVALTGLILAATSLVFSTGLNAEMGIIENLHTEGLMYVVLKKGENVVDEPRKVYLDSKPGPTYNGPFWYKDENGYYILERFTGWEGRVTIPTKYPYWASVVIIIIGLVMIANGFASKYSSKVK